VQTYHAEREFDCTACGEFEAVAKPLIGKAVHGVPLPGRTAWDYDAGKAGL
jgi:hypothetical protein